jgi:hypothetical protein
MLQNRVAISEWHIVEEDKIFRLATPRIALTTADFVIRDRNRKKRDESNDKKA